MAKAASPLPRLGGTCSNVMVMVCFLSLVTTVRGFALSASWSTPVLRRGPGAVSLRNGNSSPLRRTSGVRIQMQEGAEADDELMASLRRRMPTAVEDEKFVLPTADQMDHRAVTEKVLRALMDNDSPYENHGTEVLIAYSSPFAKKCDPWRFADPQNMATKLSGDPDACCVINCQDFRISHERDMNRCQNMLVAVQILPEEGPWTETCFCLSRVESRWLIDHIGRAAV